MLYYIQEGTNVVGESFVKIGYSKDPLRRLSELQAGNPRKLYLIFVCMPADLSDGAALEAQEHERFSELRVRETEWFLPGRALREYMLSGCSGWRGYDPDWDWRTFAPAIDPDDVAREVHEWLGEYDSLEDCQE